MKISIDGIELLEINDIDTKCLENDLLDIKEWIILAIVGKVNNCKKRLIKEWQPKLFQDKTVITIPANEDDFVSLVVSRDDYKNRVDREAAL